MVKHTQTIRWQIADELFLSVFDHFVKLAVKGLNKLNCLIQISESVASGHRR